MQFKPCTKKIYKEELEKHFGRMPAYEKKLKGGADNLMHLYTRNAQYRIPRGILEIRYNLPAIIYFVVNRGIEYDLPHTLGYIIIIPEVMEGQDLSKIIFHETVHIYFRNFGTAYIRKFCRSKKIIKIKRARVHNEITNPDTYYDTAIKYGEGCIFVALVDIGNYLGIRYFEKQYFYAFMEIRPATKEERKYYDLMLPYEQNNHPEEAVAEMLTEKIYGHLKIIK